MEVLHMIQEQAMDFGGESILQQDLISDDLICKIKGLNPNLGRPMDEFGNGDPLYSRYAAYRDEIENAEVVLSKEMKKQKGGAKYIWAKKMYDRASKEKLNPTIVLNASGRSLFENLLNSINQ